MAKPKVDPVAWAKANHSDLGGRKCSTCANKDIYAVVANWAKLWKSGDIDISFRQARDFLAEHFGYTRAVDTLRYCLVEHHGVPRRG